MAKRKVHGGFHQLRDVDLANQAGTIFTALSDNTNFPTPRPTLIELEDAMQDFRLKLEIANRKGSPLDTSLKNDARAVLIKLLKRLAFYVDDEADGSLSVILSSGFPAVKLPEKGLPPTVPQRLRLNDWLQSGQVRLDFDPVEKAWMYEYSFTDQVDEMGRPIFENQLTTTRAQANILAPLKPGHAYFVRVRARNGHGVSDWCTTESIIAR